MYPLLFTPVLFEKVWGGTGLAAFNKLIPQGKQIGESWELADLTHTAKGGAGGGAVRSTIRNGPFGGRELGQVLAAQGDSILPANKRGPMGGYPILIKYLDAQQALSLQVHPSREYASKNSDCYVKSESWLILQAAPDAVIYNGLAKGVTVKQFQDAIAKGGDALLPLLQRIPAVAGQVHTLPSGTCHALGKGVVVLEVQTASDTTYRVYDWGRSGRELHVEQAMKCIDFTGKPADVRQLRFVGKGATIGAEDIISTPDFELCARSIGPEGFDLTLHHGPFMVTGGRGRLDAWLAGNRAIALKAGDTGLAPAKYAAKPRLVGEATAPLQVVFVTVI